MWISRSECAVLRSRYSHDRRTAHTLLFLNQNLELPKLQTGELQLTDLMVKVHHHHHRLDSPWWVLAFSRSFAHLSLLRATFFQFLTPNILFHEPNLKSFNPLRCHSWQVGPVLTSSDFVTIFFSRGGVCSPTPNPQQSWRTDIFLSGLSSLADQP